jgi:hypothetical protein
MGDKYIIELEDKPFHKEDGDFLYRVKGFKSLVFDMTGIGKLTPYTEPDLEQVRKEAYEEGYKTAKIQCGIQSEKDMREVGERHYQRGLADAWEAVRKIYSFDLEEREELFPDSERFNIGSICEAYSASEAIEKIRQYEQEKRFCVGDEFENERGKRFVILKMDGTEIDRYIDEEGKTYCMIAKYKVIRKTGRHFPEIAAVLEKMREGRDG